MCVYIQEIAYKKTHLKAVYISNEDFFSPINLKNYAKQLKCRQIIKLRQFRVEDFL